MISLGRSIRVDFSLDRSIKVDLSFLLAFGSSNPANETNDFSNFEY